MTTLGGRRILITGASRGIGRAMALRAARDGASVAIAAKTVESTDKHRGTIHEVAAEVEAAGGRALALEVDVRDAERIVAAVDRVAAEWGGIDVVVNNAGAIQLTPIDQTPLKRFDLMFAINTRAVYATVQACLPHLAASDHAHVVNLCPPLDLDPRWFRRHTAYTVSKFAMTLLTIGLAEELRPQRIAVNALWPRTTIATAAIQMLGGDQLMRASRTPEILADAFHALVTRPYEAASGRTYLDEEILRESGLDDLERYAAEPGAELAPDLFVADGPIPTD